MLDDERGVGLVVLTLLHDAFKHLASVSALDDEVQVLLVVKNVVKLDNVAVVKLWGWVTRMEEVREREEEKRGGR